MAAEGFTFETVEWRESVPSTNTSLLDRMSSGEDMPGGFVLAAREQTAGRGRIGRRWVSGSGRNLAFSFIVYAGGNPQRIASLPMAVALGVVDALAGFGVEARPKWPNDIWVRNRKICGMLTEQQRTSGGKNAVVVGVGVNVNMTSEDAGGIDVPATSVLIETGRETDLESSLCACLMCIRPRVQTWREDGFAGLRAEWTDGCLFVGEEVIVQETGMRHTGRLAGFGDSGELLLEDLEGAVLRVWSGDVTSVRPL